MLSYILVLERHCQWLLILLHSTFCYDFPKKTTLLTTPGIGQVISGWIWWVVLAAMRKHSVPAKQTLKFISTFSSQFLKVNTTLQSMMNTKLSKQRFRHCYENGLIKTIQTIPHNL